MIPPRTVLAAVDFSETSKQALVLAARLARHCGAALHVLHVEDRLLKTAAEHVGIDLARETREELQRFIADAWPAAEASPELHITAGPAVDATRDEAVRLRADLIVVGSHGMSGAERLVFGSTTEGLLRRSSTSVLVVPPGWVPPRPDSDNLSGVGPLIAAVDLSDPSVAGTHAACSLAAALGCSVEFVHVVPDVPVLSRWRAHADAAVRDRLAAARHELESVIRGVACSVPSERRVEVGDVPTKLAEAATPGQNRAPLLVLGKKAPGSKGAAPGTIAYRVLSTARVPVLMYVADEEE